MTVLQRSLKDAGISDCSIHLDCETSALFVVLTGEADDRGWTTSPRSRSCGAGGAHMADILAPNPDGSPVVTPLETVFHA